MKNELFVVVCQYQNGSTYAAICNGAKETHSYIKECLEDWDITHETHENSSAATFIEMLPTLEQIKAIVENEEFEFLYGYYITVHLCSDYSKNQAIEYVKNI